MFGLNLVWNSVSYASAIYDAVLFGDGRTNKAIPGVG